MTVSNPIKRIVWTEPNGRFGFRSQRTEEKTLESIAEDGIAGGCDFLLERRRGPEDFHRLARRAILEADLDTHQPRLIDFAQSLLVEPPGLKNESWVALARTALGAEGPESAESFYQVVKETLAEVQPWERLQVIRAGLLRMAEDETTSSWARGGLFLLDASIRTGSKKSVLRRWWDQGPVSQAQLPALLAEAIAGLGAPGERHRATQELLQQTDLFPHLLIESQSRNRSRGYDATRKARVKIRELQSLALPEPALSPREKLRRRSRDPEKRIVARALLAAHNSLDESDFLNQVITPWPSEPEKLYPVLSRLAETHESTGEKFRAWGRALEWLSREPSYGGAFGQILDGLGNTEMPVEARLAQIGQAFELLNWPRTSGEQDLHLDPDFLLIGDQVLDRVS